MSSEGATQQPVRAVLWGRRRQLAGATALLAAHQLGEAAVPLVLGFAIDDSLAPPRLGRLCAWLAVLGADFLALSLSWRFGSRTAAAARLGVTHDLRTAVAARALDARGIAADRLDGGELVTIAGSDARRVADGARSAVAALAGVAALLASLVAVATIAPLLAAVVIAGAIATLGAVAALSRSVELRSHAEQRAGGRTAALAVDLVGGLRVLAGIRATDAAGVRYRAASADAVRASIRAADADAVVDGIAALAVGCYLVAVAAVSAELALHERVSIGAVIAVLGLSQLLLGPLQAIAQAVPSARRGRASATRIDALLTAAPLLSGDGAPAIPAGGELAVEALRDADLDGVSFLVRAGALHGVVSDSPAAAETLVRSLAGERAADGGRVRIGQVDLAGVRPDVRRAAMLVWPHRAVPLGGTVAELVGASGHGDRVTRDAIEAAAADDVLDRIPGGWDASIVEGAASLSGGERQRLGLARALLERPPVLVLHEPTSAVDAVTELAIADGIRRQRQGLTTVLVTTSATLLAACDTSTLIAGGHVVASGAHGELLADPRYRQVVGR